MNNTPTNAEVTANAKLHNYDLNTLEGRTAEFLSDGDKDAIIVDLQTMFEDFVSSEDFAIQDADFRMDKTYRYNKLLGFLYKLDKNVPTAAIIS